VLTSTVVKVGVKSIYIQQRFLQMVTLVDLIGSSKFQFVKE